MISNVQIAIIAGIPLLMIYTTIIFCYGYRRGHEEGFNIAMHILNNGIPLDKIRNEIEGKYRVVLKSTPKDDWAVRWNDCIDEVLQIIDKYRNEVSE